MTSVRESLNIVGQSVSLKQVAHQRNASFPLSLREFVGAPPPGRLLRKVISLDFLQRKFDVFFNERVRPLFQIRLNSKERKFGQSALTVAMLDPAAMSDPNREEYDHEHPVVLKELAGPGEVLELPGVIYGTHRFYFQDVNSDGLTLNVVPGQLIGLEIAIHFETEGGIEIKVEDFNAHDIDFDAFNIKLKMEFGSRDGLLDLVGFMEEIEQAINSATITSAGFNQVMLTVHFRGEVIRASGPDPSSLKGLVKEGLTKRFINTDVSVNVDFLPDGVVANKVEKNLNAKIFEALKSSDNRDALNRMVTRWLVGGDSYVAGVSSDDQSLIIDYIIPPGQLEPFPENPQTPLDQGLLANIDHIVVLMMENRSFDHMLGYLSKEGGRSDIDGLHGGETNSDGKGQNYPSFPLPDTTFNESPDHSHQPVENQINGGKMNGFVTSFVAKFPEIDNPGKIMGYHTAAHVPVYDALASQFLICQRWFAAHPGPTFCNRFYTLTGRLNRDAFGRFEFDNFTGNDFKPVPTRTLFDHLTDHGVSWHFYEHRYCSLRLYARYTTDNTFIVDANDPAKGFFASAQAGTLPAVSFIDPNFIDEPDGQDNDDGAPSNITAGQNLIGRVVNAVVHSPQWNKTLLLITYDEHGGFYDHVNPLDPRFRDTAKPVSGIDHYGVRVPTFIISPWVDKGKVSNVVFDHTSIAKTIARRFMSANPPDMGERMAAANDLSMVLRSTPRTDTPNIPVPPAPVQNAALARRAAPDAESDDFKEVLRTMRSRYPVRR